MPTSNSWIDLLTSYDFPKYPSVTGLLQPITMRSIGEFIWALIWAALLLTAFTGWGKACCRLLRAQRLPVSVACSVGVAIVVLAGGLLNLGHAITNHVLAAIIAMGFALYTLLRKERTESYLWRPFWAGSSSLTRFLIVIALLILFFRVAGTVRLGNFNISDDSSAYLVFPKKMLAVHHFASDPFSDRRVISSLGGAYFLQDCILIIGSLSHIAMADRTLGLILMAGALFDIGILFGLSNLQIAVMEFIVFLVPQDTINLTFVMLPISLLLGMVWLIFQSIENRTRDDWKNALQAGLIGGAIISLKSTYLPIVAAYALIPYCLLGRRNNKISRLFLPLAIGFGALIVMAAWMVAMKAASGTYLFPIFGPGVDYTAYGIFGSMPRFPTARSVIKVFLQGTALLVPIFILLVYKNGNFLARFSISIIVSSALAITAFNYRSGGDFIWRYNFPQFLCAIVIFYVATAAVYRDGPDRKAERIAYSCGVLALIFMIFYYDASGHNPRPFREVSQEVRDYRQSLLAGVSGVSLASPSMRAKYQAVEDAIPAGSTSLENVGRPYLFKYNSKKIYIMDWPGAASPQPGWPLGRTSSEVAEYLRRHSVRYIIYDYRYAFWEDAGACVSLERPKLYSSELYVLFWMTVLTDHQFDQLLRHYKVMRDDGSIAVVDLYQPVEGVQSPETVWTLHTNKEEMCSEVMARYLKGIYKNDRHSAAVPGTATGGTPAQ